MILDLPISEVGRSTGQHLDALRKQLGVGCDPAYDYSAMLALQNSVLGKKKPRASSPKGGGSGAGSLSQPRSPAAGIDELKRAMSQQHGDGGGAAEDEPAQAKIAEHHHVPHVLGGARWAAEQKRPSASFVATSRNDISKLDISNRWRAPPVGSYRPKDEMLQPRLKGIVAISTKDPVRSRKALQFEQEMAELKASGQSIDHLTRHGVSVELLDEPPERARRRQVVFKWDKGSERPGPVESGGIVYNDNSFTAGVLDGDLKCSELQRIPCFDFANLSTYEAKPRAYYFQPGQYAVKLEAVKPGPVCKTIFDKQRPRKPLREVVGRVEIISRAGAHLPDRSLSRSCPLLEPRMMVPEFKHYTSRPDLK